MPLAPQSPYPIIVYFVTNYRPHLSHFGQICNFCDPGLVTFYFMKTHFVVVVVFFKPNEEHFNFHLQYKHPWTYGAPFVSKLFVNVMFNVVVTYPIKCSCDSINQPLLFFTLISFYGSWRSIFYLDIILLPWHNIFYLDIILLPWHNIFYLDIVLLPWHNIFYLDIFLLPWCDILYLDIILLPWWNICYFDIILLP